MARACIACGVPLVDDARFCGSCGAPQETAISRDGGGERRYLTVVFCDLVNSTPLAGRLDPEDLRDLVHRYQETAGSEIRRHGGRIGQYLGDGVEAYFGYPQAHDDDARRAVMAALTIVERIGALRNDNMAARIAVHTGPVVVGGQGTSGGRRLADEIVGLTTNIVARLQEHARPNSVIISGATAALVSGYFDLHPLGSFALKGVDGLMDGYEPRKSRQDITRFDLAVAKGLTPFLGRTGSLSLLTSKWSSAGAGNRTTVLVVGEPGIGKSRLLREFRLRVSDQAHDFIELRCSALHANHSLHPVLQHLRSEFQPAGEPSGPDEVANRLKTRVIRATAPLQPTMALIGALLDLPPTADEPELPEGSELRLELTLSAVRDVLVGGPGGRPILIVVEDLQWADPTTLSLIGSLTAQPTARPTMVVCTTRTGFAPPWTGRPDVDLLELPRLDDRSAREIVLSLTRGSRPGDRVVMAIVERSDGVPLFIEEIAGLVRSRIAEDGKVASAEIPATLRDLLVARIDRLGSAKKVLQAASVIGREFSFDLLNAVHAGGATGPAHLLARPDIGDLITEIDTPGRKQFTFRHALIRDAAYATLLREERRVLHERVARWLIDDHPGVTSDLTATPGVIAYHCARAGLVREAIDHFHKAASESMATGAVAEADAFLEQALALLATTPAEPERAAAELMLHAARGPVLMAELGYAHPAVEQTFSRARQLCDDLGDPVEIFPVLYGLVAYSAVRSDLATASDLADRLLRSAEAADDNGLTMLAHAASAQTLFIMGNFRSAADHARRCVTRLDPARQSDYRIIFGEDPGIICRGVQSWLLWLLGRPDEALLTIDQAVSAARSLGHQFTLAESLTVAARLYHYLRDVDGVRRVAVEALAIASGHGFPLFSAEATVWKGWADAFDRDPGGPRQLRSGLEAYRSSGTQMFVPHHLVLLAEALRRVGDHAEALQALSEAHDLAVSLGSLDHQVETLRMSAVVTAERDPHHPAVDPLLTSATVLSREQGALSLEVRVAVSRLKIAMVNGDAETVRIARSELADACERLPAGARSRELDEARGLAAGVTVSPRTPLVREGEMP